MAKRKSKSKKKDKKKKKQDKQSSLTDHIKEETLQAIAAVVFFVLAIFLIMASFQSAGVAGEWIFSSLDTLLGVGYMLLPLLFVLLGISFLKTLKQRVALTQTIGGILFFIAGLGLLEVMLQGIVEEPGGVIGGAIADPMISLVDVYVTVLVLGALLLIAMLVMFDRVITLDSVYSLSSLFMKKKDDSLQQAENQEIGTYRFGEGSGVPTGTDADMPPVTNNAVNEGSPEDTSPEPAPQPQKKDFDLTLSESFNVEYEPPPLKLLEKDSGKPGVGDIKANANIIKRTLHNFNVQVEMDEVSVGPTVSRYSLKPAEGVKLSRIVGLQNDLALALAAHPLRIEAPIPGKSLVGIEMPNTVKATIGLGTLLGSPNFKESDKPLLVALGKSITGESHLANLGKMPHLLIAGATGSGKSVTIHSIITSLLYRNSPDYMRYIMIDPKRVELTLYNSIPHLLTPVITDPKQAILALKWAQKEMDRRYDILETEKVRDIGSYHKKVVEPAYANTKKKKSKKEDDTTEEDELPEKMPYIVIIIDELADIMQTYPRELESSIVRLAQMSRAVGIHLILSTQRPSVNVITGLIKANIPARIALQVTSQVDSRTILDTSGAEKLLGAGDMLYVSGEMAKPTRLQSAFISEDEVKKVVHYLADQYQNELPEKIDFAQAADSSSLSSVSFDDDGDDDDEMYEDARSLVISMNKASTSLIQRKLKLGYARAARIVDMLEERGVVGPAEGSKPRRVLINDESREYGNESRGVTDSDQGGGGDNGQNNSTL